jgi:hypothetical protein
VSLIFPPRWDPRTKSAFSFSPQYVDHRKNNKQISNNSPPPLSPLRNAIIHNRIDNEHERQRNIDQWRLKQTEKLNKLREPTLPSGFDFNTPADLKINGDAAMKVQMRKDRRMAKDDPSRYCADRCVSTGNCQVWEDMFDMDADEVQKFCKECVLSLDEEPCDIPEKFIENAGKNSWELRP